MPNPVVLTGDIHSNWVNDLRVDDRKPETPVVATEFVGTSITSGGNGPRRGRRASTRCWPRTRASGSTTRQRGYVRCTVTPESLASDYRVVEDVTPPGAPAVEPGVVRRRGRQAGGEAGLNRLVHPGAAAERIGAC